MGVYHRHCVPFRELPEAAFSSVVYTVDIEVSVYKDDLITRAPITHILVATIRTFAKPPAAKDFKSPPSKLLFPPDVSACMLRSLSTKSARPLVLSLHIRFAYQVDPRRIQAKSRHYTEQKLSTYKERAFSYYTPSFAPPSVLLTPWH